MRMKLGPLKWNASARADPSVAGAVGRFALAGALALAVVGVISFFVLRDVGTSEALSQARDLTRLVGKGIVEPNVGNGLIEGREHALRRFDGIVRSRVLEDPIVRVKLWTGSGRLVYSDEPRLIGQRYQLQRDDLASLRSGEVESEVSDLSRPENRFERGRGKLLEVYLPVRGPHGRPLLFEAYQEFDTVESSARDTWLAFAPALIAALVVLYLVQLPLAASMARRIRRASEERETLLQHAVDASVTERRRIAGDIHDGVVQDLAGLSYSLAASAEGDEPRVEEALRDGAERARQSVRELRGLLVEIYPPRLREAGLSAALSDQMAPLAARGIDTRVAMPENLELAPETEALFFRVAQEAIRNSAKHASPTRVEARVSRNRGGAQLLIEDDGRGFVSEPDGGGSRSGHLGLELLRDLAEETGATLKIESAPGAGTRVRLDTAAP
jgi:two-component system, NarL family, sensor kinase